MNTKELIDTLKMLVSYQEGDEVIEEIIKRLKDHDELMLRDDTLTEGGGD